MPSLYVSWVRLLLSVLLHKVIAILWEEMIEPDFSPIGVIIIFKWVVFSNEITKNNGITYFLRVFSFLGVGSPAEFSIVVQGKDEVIR